MCLTQEQFIQINRYNNQVSDICKDNGKDKCSDEHRAMKVTLT